MTCPLSAASKAFDIDALLKGVNPDAEIDDAVEMAAESTPNSLVPSSSSLSTAATEFEHKKFELIARPSSSSSAIDVSANAAAYGAVPVAAVVSNQVLDELSAMSDHRPKVQPSSSSSSSSSFNASPSLMDEDHKSSNGLDLSVPTVVPVSALLERAGVVQRNKQLKLQQKKEKKLKKRSKSISRPGTGPLATSASVVVDAGSGGSGGSGRSGRSIQEAAGMTD